MNKYIYFISYSHSDNYTFGFGNFFHTSSEKLDTVEKVQELSASFAKDNHIKGFSIINIVLLREDLINNEKSCYKCKNHRK